MTKQFEYTQIHYQGPGEGVRTRPPDVETIIGVGEVALGQQREYDKFDQIVAKQGLNEKYQDQIDGIKEYFAKDGLAIAPIAVVSPEDFEEIAGQQRESGTERGKFINGHAIIVEDPAAIEAFGPDYILGIGLHEAAHSASQEHNLVVSKKNGGSGSSEMLNIHTVSGGRLDKYSWLNDEIRPRVRGSFYEEAYADLKRVRGLREMGKAHDLPGTCILNVSPGSQPDEEVKIIYVGSNRVQPLVHSKHNAVSMPVEFTMGAVPREDGKNATFSIPSATAAYGLELLDQHIPGLFEDIEAAHQGDADAHRSYVKKIESVKPGLYKELRDLDYNSSDFRDGLIKIAQALDIEEMEVRG